MNFQLRVSRDANDLSGVYNEFSSNSSACFVFRHHPDNGCNRIHHHLYFFGYGKGETTARKFLKKQSHLYDTSGNPDWALSLTCGTGNDKRQIDVSGAWLYGTTEKLISDAFPWRKNISPARVEELKVLAKHFWCGGVVELAGKSIKKPREKNEKDDKYKVIEAIAKIFQERHKCHSYTDSSGFPRHCGAPDHLKEIYQIAIEELRARRIRWSAFDLDRYVMPAFAQGTKHKNDINDFIDEMVKKNLRL